MRAEAEDYFLNPPPGSAAERAAEFGIDLTLTLEISGSRPKSESANWMILSEASQSLRRQFELSVQQMPLPTKIIEVCYVSVENFSNYAEGVR